MFCNNCGQELFDNANVCSNCGNQLNNFKTPGSPVEYQHRVPKCTCCGYIGEWKLEPVLRTMDIILGILFLFIGIIPGIIYIGVVALIRSNKDNRAKICPKCKGRNLWTFIY